MFFKKLVNVFFVVVSAAFLFSNVAWSEEESGKTSIDNAQLSKGTVVKVELAENYSSQNNKVGDIVRYTVINPVKVGDKVVIDQGAEATGKVIQATPAKGWGKGGKLNISVEFVKAVDGSNVHLTATLGDSQSWSAGKTIIGVYALGVFAGGGMKGKKVELGKGTKIDVFVAEDTMIGPAGAPKAVQAPVPTTVTNTKSICLGACEEKNGDDFKKCMKSCEDCGKTCAGLSPDDTKTCIEKCI